MFHHFPSVPDFSEKTFLVTGGAGFIGSHVCDFLITAKAKKIVVIDNLSTGDVSNIEAHTRNEALEFIKGDITDFDTCLRMSKGVDVIIHLAALGSVPRSVSDPLATHMANSTGFLNILWASRQNSITRFIYASSSSVYGDCIQSPKKEGHEGKPLSPYAATKQNNEAYAVLFYELYGVQTIGLRFFNIFGPRQNKNGPYAAFMPLAISAAKNKQDIHIFGDGSQSRDFTYVANAVWAVYCSVKANEQAAGKAFNIGCGKSSGLLEVINFVQNIGNVKVNTEFKPERRGDIKNSLADLTLASLLLQYEPIYSLEEGIKITYQSFN